MGQKHKEVVQLNKQTLINIMNNSVCSDTDKFRCHTYLCGRIDCEQREGVHPTGRGDVEDGSLLPVKQKYKQRLFYTKKEV